MFWLISGPLKTIRLKFWANQNKTMIDLHIVLDRVNGKTLSMLERLVLQSESSGERIVLDLSKLATLRTEDLGALIRIAQLYNELHVETIELRGANRTLTQMFHELNLSSLFKMVDLPAQMSLR